jgi:hypothetical protein
VLRVVEVDLEGGALATEEEEAPEVVEVVEEVVVTGAEGAVEGELQEEVYYVFSSSSKGELTISTRPRCTQGAGRTRRSWS